MKMRRRVRQRKLKARTAKQRVERGSKPASGAKPAKAKKAPAAKK